MIGFSGIVARRYLWAQRKNLSSGLIALFSCLGVTIGTWLLVFVLAATNGFETEVKGQLIGKDAHLELKLRYDQPMAAYDSLLEVMAAHPGVTYVSPYIVYQSVFAHKKNFSGCLVFGIDPVRSQNVLKLVDHMKWGEYRFDSVPDVKGEPRNGVVMGYALANRLGLNIGDKSLMYIFDGGSNFTASLTPRAKMFVLAGTFETGMYEFDQSLAYISLEAAQEAFRMEGAATGIQAKIENPMQSRRVSRELEEQLGYPYSVIDWQEKNRTLIKWMEIEKVLFGLALGIIIIIAAFNIISSLVMNVNDKKREIGILRAMGATRGDILRIFILEGFIIGVLGSVLGVILGLGSCYLQQKFGIIKLPGDVYFVTELPVIPQVLDVVVVVAVTLVLCGTASIIPALKASLQNPVDAIRYE